MNQELHDETELRKYLLGELNANERVMVEQRLFLDDAYLQLYEDLEDELVDEYSDQGLTSEERERFEFHFLASPERREDLRITQALKRVSASEINAVDPKLNRPKTNRESDADTFVRKSFLASLFGRRPIAALAFVAAIIVMSVIAWRFYQSKSSQPEQPPLLSEDSGGANNSRSPDDSQSGNTKDALDGDQKGSDRAQHQPSPIASKQPARVLVGTFTIPLGGVIRSGQPLTVLSIPARRGVVSLTFPLKDIRDYDSYRARMRRNGLTIRSWDELPAQVDPTLGKIVVVQLPARLLSSSRYEVRVAGLTSDGTESEVGRYEFDVAKK